MTVGEKIQFYRKKIGLSQEALGQKLLVSRQTVSLWEMDKTLPTIDNLLRLKEIFSVSIDDILSESDPQERKDDEIKENKPTESYIFQYEKSDFQELFKKVRFPLIKRAMIFSLTCFVIFVFFAATNAPDLMIGLLLGYFLIGIISHIKFYLSYTKTWKSSEIRILQSTYSYEIFDGYFVLNISRNEEITRTLKFYFEDIEKFQSFGNYLILEIANQSYIIKKDSLVSDSVLLSFHKDTQKKHEMKIPKDKLKTVSFLLLILSIGTILFSLIGSNILSEINHKDMPENMWVFFLFLPIPISSIIFGFYLKGKGYKYKANIIAGLIMVALLCIYGSFTFMFADTYSHSDEPILNTEKMLNIDIPIHSQITTQKYTNGISYPRGSVYSTSDIYFKSTAVTDFEKSLPNHPKWITSIPSNLVGITSYLCEITESDYYIIYNVTTGECNKLPSQSGTYVFINILYNAESNTMKLVEYQIEYTK